MRKPRISPLAAAALLSCAAVAAPPPQPAGVEGVVTAQTETATPAPAQAWVLEIPSPMRNARAASKPGEIITTTYRRPPPMLGSVSVAGATVVSRPGDARLAAIARAEQEFFDSLAREPEKWPEAERNKRGQEINDDYVKYLSSNSGDAIGLILYGKYLRRIGEREQAFAVFQRAHRVDPKLAVVNQQLAAYMAEEGEYAGALGFMLRAVELAPNEPLYQYQLGEVLDVYYDLFIKDKIYDSGRLNRAIAEAFARAAELDPREPAFLWRQADCYYDMLDPDWSAALAAWDRVAPRLTIPLERDVVRLHRARCLIELRRRDEALVLIEQPTPALLDGVREQLRERIAAAPDGAPRQPDAKSAPAANTVEVSRPTSS